MRNTQTGATPTVEDVHPHRELVPFTRAAATETPRSADTEQHFVDLGDASRWFDTVVISDLAGGSDGARVFGADSTAETWYQIVQGRGTLHTADGVEEVRQFDAVYFAPGTGAELRAEPGATLSWLTISSNGGDPTPFAAGDRGESTRSEAAAPAPTVFRRREMAPRQWPANSIGASAKPWWFYTVDDESRWYHSNCVSCIAPGGSSTFHTHMERFEGPYETWYIALQGSALIRGEFGDRSFDESPSGVFVPADAPHQILNNGEDMLWYCTLSSRGGAALALDTYSVPSGPDRPGYLEEYNRIQASRAARGLQVP